MRQVAAAAGVPERADALTASVLRRPRAIRVQRARPGHKPKPRDVRHRPPVGARALADLIAIGPGSINELIEIAGGINVMAIAGQPEYPRISMETVLRLNPDVIVDTVDMGDTDAERRGRQPINERLWSVYGTLTAVKTGHVHAATTDALVVPGPRVVEAVEWVAALLRSDR
jgi:iron complex transport system substrate-binding protein